MIDCICNGFTELVKVMDGVPQQGSLKKNHILAFSSKRFSVSPDILRQKFPKEIHIQDPERKTRILKNQMQSEMLP